MLQKGVFFFNFAVNIHEKKLQPASFLPSTPRRNYFIFKSDGEK